MEAPAVRHVYIRALAHIFRNLNYIRESPENAYASAVKIVDMFPSLALEVQSIQAGSGLAAVYANYLRRDGRWGF